MTSELEFEVWTPIGFSVRVTRRYWDVIANIKHPVMCGRQAEVRQALFEPDEVRQSRRDPDVYLFYRKRSVGRWTCAVAKRLGSDGFLITAFPTSAIKEGQRIWIR